MKRLIILLVLLLVACNASIPTTPTSIVEPEPEAITPVILLQPKDGGMGISLSPTFKWKGGVAPYFLELTTLQDFKDGAQLTVGTIMDQSLKWEWTNLRPRTKYLWRVSDQGNREYGPFSKVSSFTTKIILN